MPQEIPILDAYIPIKTPSIKPSTADCGPAGQARQDSMEPTYQSPQFHGGPLCLSDGIKGLE